MGVLDGYDSGRAAPVNNGGFTRSSGIGGGGGGGGGFGNPTNQGRFSKYDYTASFADKSWSVKLNGVQVASESNSNTSTVNRQLARDWIENDWKRRKIEEANNTPLDPGLQDNDEDEEIPDTSTDTSDSDTQIVGLSDDQRFMLIGLVVVGALLGFIKR